MGTSLDHLLPAADEVLRCAEHARRIEVDPGGTAIRADRIVLVAAPLPWPKPALDHPAVQPVAEALRGAAMPTRVLAFVPDGSAAEGAGHAAEAHDGATLVVYEREGASAVERRYRTTAPADAAALVRALIEGDQPEGSAVARPGLVAEHRPARPAVLVCTQGSHDVCCGSEGTRLAGELQARIDATAAAVGGPDQAVQLYRVSHTGGHRFAPTAMTLPDGRMWAGLTMARVDAILSRVDGALAELAPTCRGWWGADGGPAQVAERAVLAARGWSLDSVDRRVGVVDQPDGRVLATVSLSGAASADPVDGPGDSPNGQEERWEVELVEGRSVPTIACRQPGGLPAKTAREHDVLTVRRLA